MNARRSHDKRTCSLRQSPSKGLQGVIPPVALQLQAAQQAPAPLQRLGGGVVAINQRQRTPRRFCR
jgi:hypothetical protein